ncbi:hypothetical protein HGA13_12300 [Nocardia speluncae]|uniref:Acyl-CoA oxidase n=1 Tax=Nocardia speluncae TaxID=419477 RepID=A0A846XJ61_9NOCA|nr:hypothetical protein [Nocardia speluncae]NKY33854.1 hypothetical protein [Nocardia speluncae]
MTTTTTVLITHIGYRDEDPTVTGLRGALFGDHLGTHRAAMDIMLRLGDVAPDGDVTYREETRIGSALLPRLIADLGLPARKIAQDVHLRGAVCDSAAVAATHVLTVLNGHFALTCRALLELGNGSDYVQACLADLDSGRTLGVFAHTELGGTNGGADLQVVAVRDCAAGGYRLYSSSIEAVKAMANLADPDVPAVAVFTACLEEDGEDKGVLAFASRFRSADGVLAEGVEIYTLSPKLGSAMPHALIKLNGLLVPEDGVLCGDWGGFDDAGAFVSEVPVRQRFQHTVGPLIHGRLDLGIAMNRSAGAGAAAAVGFTGQRPHGDSDALQRDLVTAVADTFACGVLGRMVRDTAADPDIQPPLGLWVMVLKPLLTTLAQDALIVCRERLASHGILRCNYLPDAIANVFGGKTAEGDTLALQVAAGRYAKALCLLTLPETPAEKPWWLEMITAREGHLATDLYLATGIGRDEYEPDGDAVGLDSARADMAHTTGIRLAVTAALIAADQATDPHAATVAYSVAAVVALGYLAPRGTWFQRRGLQSDQRAAEIETGLLRHRRILLENLTFLAAAFDVPQLPGAPVFALDYRQAFSEITGWGPDSFVRPR